MADTRTNNNNNTETVTTKSCQSTGFTVRRLVSDGIGRLRKSFRSLISQNTDIELPLRTIQFHLAVSYLIERAKIVTEMCRMSVALGGPSVLNDSMPRASWKIASPSDDDLFTFGSACRLCPYDWYICITQPTFFQLVIIPSFRRYLF